MLLKTVLALVPALVLVLDAVTARPENNEPPIWFPRRRPLVLVASTSTSTTTSTSIHLFFDLPSFSGRSQTSMRFGARLSLFATS